MTLLASFPLMTMILPMDFCGSITSRLIRSLLRDSYTVNIDDPAKYRTKEQVDKEMYNVGGSIVRVREVNGKWEVVKNDQAQSKDHS